jgi:hypothetical protein
MLVGRLIGWVFLLAALVVLGRDLIAWYDTGVLSPIVLGQLWFDLDRGSLNLAQAVVQRYVAAWLWDPVITALLLLWAVPVLALPGLALIYFCQQRNGHGPARRRSRRRR